MKLVENETTQKEIVQKAWDQMHKDARDGVEYFVAFIETEDGFQFYTERGCNLHELLGRLEQAKHIGHMIATAGD